MPRLKSKQLTITARSSNALHLIPPVVRCQGPLAIRAFLILLEKPGRSLRSIARELGTSGHTLQRLRDAGDWMNQLARLAVSTPESLALAARHEAHRSRAASLAANPLYEAAMDAAMVEMVEVDEQGAAVLKAGVDVADVEKLLRARQTHVKTTQLLTGEAEANQRAVAALGAPRIVFGSRDLAAEVRPIETEVVAEVVSPAG